MGNLIYLLDSNVLSELTQPEPDTRLLGELERRRSVCATATVVMHELAYGVARLPEGARKRRLQEFVEGLGSCGMAILPYDLEAALWHARERARLEADGLTPPFRDGQIAAIAASRDMTLVSRNLADFAHFRGLSSESWFTGTPS